MIRWPAWITIWIAWMVALGLIITVGVFVFRWVTAEPRGKLQAKEEIQSGPFRIQAYDHFFDACASVQANEAQIDSLNAELVDTTDPADVSRIRTNLTGVTATRQRAIFEYNADARKSYTEGQFRANDLPYQLDSAPYDGGNKTTC